MAPAQAYAFVVFAVVAAITPGPSNVLLSAAGASAGIRGGLPCLLGVSGGMAAMLFAVSLGLGSLVLNHPGAVGAMRWAGAAFLLWMAWRIATAPAGDTAAHAPPVGFLGAAAFQWLNPKSWLVATAAAATYLEPRAGHLAAQAAVLAGLFAAAALPCGFAWLAFGAAMRRLLASARRRRVFSAAMGLLLAACVVPMLSPA